jgi:hypothetical protein
MNARVAILLALAAAACGPKVSKEQPAPSEPAYVFPHSPHVDADVACQTCHPIDKATKLEANVRHVKVPANASKTKPCSDCHDADPALKVPARAQPFRVRFDHAAHLPRVKGDCKKCHPVPPEKGDKEYKGPAMAACTACHNHQQDFAQARCTPCHVDLKGYAKPQSAFKHEGEWLRAHGALARPSGESCAACHDQTYCAECHSPQTAAGRPSIVFPERVDRTFIHRGDYVSRHMIDAGANPASCRRCHGSAFCETCHEQQGFSKFTPSPEILRPETHNQANWAIRSGGGRPLHGDAARRDIASCAACHDQGAQATCVGCHADRAGPDTAPHPKKFLSKHDQDDIANNAMCRICHTSGTVQR